MAVISPAIGIQSGSHSAKAFRQLTAALAGAEVQTFANSVGKVDVGHGLVRSTHLAVTQNGTPNMSVNVAKGTALVNGTSSLAQAVYAVTNDATANLAIATADATNPRRDLVVIQIRDNTEDASGSNDARLFVVTGTPAASPADPTIPPGALVIARVAVAAATTSIVNANITTVAGLARGSNWNIPWGTIGYAEITSDLGAFSGLTILSGLGISFTAIAGRRYRFTFEFEGALSVATDIFLVNIENTTVTLKRALVGPHPNTSSQTYNFQYLNNTSLSGALTWRTNGVRSSGTGNLIVGASATSPAFVHLEDVGPLP